MPVFIVVFSAYETGFLIRGFGSLCNLGLSKTLRFSLQRHKTAKSCAFCDSLPVFALECFSANETGFLIRGFGSLYNLGLPKEQRFFLERHKSEKLQNLITI